MDKGRSCAARAAGKAFFLYVYYRPSERQRVITVYYMTKENPTACTPGLHQACNIRAEHALTPRGPRQEDGTKQRDRNEASARSVVFRMRPLVEDGVERSLRRTVSCGIARQWSHHTAAMRRCRHRARGGPGSGAQENAVPGRQRTSAMRLPAADAATGVSRPAADDHLTSW